MSGHAEETFSALDLILADVRLTGEQNYSMRLEPSSARILTRKIDALLAENQRLETNLASEVKLRKALGNQAFHFKAENQRYEKALERIARGSLKGQYIEEWDGYSVRLPKVVEIAREALAGDTE